MIVRSGRILRGVIRSRSTSAGSPILVHPLTGNDLADHRDFAMWLGDSATLDLSAL